MNKILYTSHFEIFKKLTPDQVYQLVMKIGDETFELTDPICIGIWLSMEFDFSKQKENYTKKVERNRENGKKGGRPKQTQNNQVGFMETELNPTNPENLKDKDKDKDKDNITSSLDADVIWRDDVRFSKIVKLFPSSKQNGVADAYKLVWIHLGEKEKKEVEEITPVYIQRNNLKQHYIKNIGKYFEERFWNIDKVSLDLMNGNKPQSLTYQQQIQKIIV